MLSPEPSPKRSLLASSQIHKPLHSLFVAMMRQDATNWCSSPPYLILPSLINWPIFSLDWADPQPIPDRHCAHHPPDGVPTHPPIYPLSLHFQKACPYLGVQN